MRDPRTESTTKDQSDLVHAGAVGNGELPGGEAFAQAGFHLVGCGARPTPPRDRDIGYDPCLLNRDAHDDLSGQGRVGVQAVLRITELQQLLLLPNGIAQRGGR